MAASNQILSLRSSLLSSPKTKSYGPFLLSACPNIAELLAGVGYGHIVVDMEHSPIGVSDTQTMLRAIDSAYRGAGNHSTSEGLLSSRGPTPIVRVPSHQDIATTKRILDILKTPAGIIFPMVENAEQARNAVASIKYPPHYIYSSSNDDNDYDDNHDDDYKKFKGLRGCAHPFVRASSYGKDVNYFDKSSKEDILTIVQVESESAIHNIPEIGMVDGVDCIFLGPFDISCSIGKMGKFEKDGEVMKLLRYAEKLVLQTSIEKSREKSSRLILGGFRSAGRSLSEMFSEEVGYQFISGSVDLGDRKSVV